MSPRCIAPGEIQAGDLLAYTDGTAAPEIVAHVTACAYCTAEVAALQRTQAVIDGALYRTNCPDADSLLLYEAGLLNRRDRPKIERHLATCAFCQADVRLLAAVPAAVQTSEPSPLDRIKQTGKELWEALRQPPPTLQPALALRGEGQRQQLFQAGSYQIMVTITPPLAAENVYQVEGQLLQDGDLPASGGPAYLLQGEIMTAQDEVDRFGYFTFANVLPGRYTLYLALPDATIHLGLEIGD